MEIKLKEGMRQKLEKVVQKKDSAAEYGSGMVDVFATPAMIAFMEQTAMTAVADKLPEGYGTVGMEVCVRHKRPTPVGKTVYCEAILTNVSGKKLLFGVRAWDEEGEIGNGTHSRYIINNKEFMKQLF